MYSCLSLPQSLPVLHVKQRALRVLRLPPRPPVHGRVPSVPRRDEREHLHRVWSGGLRPPLECGGQASFSQRWPSAAVRTHHDEGLLEAAALRGGGVHEASVPPASLSLCAQVALFVLRGAVLPASPQLCLTGPVPVHTLWPRYGPDEGWQHVRRPLCLQPAEVSQLSKGQTCMGQTSYSLTKLTKATLCHFQDMHFKFHCHISWLEWPQVQIWLM